MRIIIALPDSAYMLTMKEGALYMVALMLAISPQLSTTKLSPCASRQLFGHVQRAPG